MLKQFFPKRRQKISRIRFFEKWGKKLSKKRCFNFGIEKYLPKKKTIVIIIHKKYAFNISLSININIYIELNNLFSNNLNNIEIVRF